MRGWNCISCKFSRKPASRGRWFGLPRETRPRLQPEELSSEQQTFAEICKLLGSQLKASRRRVIPEVGVPCASWIGEKCFNARVWFAAGERMLYLLDGLDVMEHFEIRAEKDKVRYIEPKG